MVRKAYWALDNEKDIEDLQLAKHGTLYSALLTMYTVKISWGLNFVGSPGSESFATQKLYP